ncbi:hypothetical protein AB0368_23530 [Actinoplanes sp. NPDC051475]|uniref:hypothetical protein n=1 Tax=Actinoplanes sp. NPDC051475 TaxID=3157225 RepID=UPI00344DAC5C
MVEPGTELRGLGAPERVVDGLVEDGSGGREDLSPAHDRTPGGSEETGDRPPGDAERALTPYAAPRPLTNDTKLVALGSRRPADALLGGTTNAPRWTNQGGFPPVETNGHRNGEIGPRHGGTPTANGQSPVINGALPHSRSPFAPPPDTPPLYAPSPFATAGNPPMPVDPLAPPPGSGPDTSDEPLGGRPVSGQPFLSGRSVTGEPLPGTGEPSPRTGETRAGEPRTGEPRVGELRTDRPSPSGRPVSGQPAASGSAPVPLPPSTRPAATQPVSGQPTEEPSHDAWAPPVHRGGTAGSASIPASPGGAPLDPFPGFAPGLSGAGLAPGPSGAGIAPGPSGAGPAPGPSGAGQAPADRYAPSPAQPGAAPASADLLGGWGSEPSASTAYRLDPLPAGGRRAVPDLDEPQTGRRATGDGDENAARRTGDDRPGGRRSADDAPAGRRAARETAGVAPGQPLRPGDLDESSISFWDEAAGDRLRGEWHEVKAQFVDDPVAALTRAHDLLTDAVHELTESMLAERDQLDPLRGTEHPDTESMRMAMRGYREFLDRILGL